MTRRSTPLTTKAGLLLLTLACLPASSPAAELQTAAAPSRPAAVPDLDELLSIAAQVVRSSKRLSRIWPGYWPEDQAFILHVKGFGALLVSPGPRPAGFEPIPDSELPNELRGTAFFHKDTLKGTERPFVIGYPIGEGKTAMLANIVSIGGKREPAATMGLLLHEQFHGYQQKTFKGREQQFVDPLAVKDRVAFAAAAEVERSILADALRASSKREREQLLRQYLAVRRERERGMAPQAVKTEQGFERSEGTANYSETAGMAAIKGGGDESLVRMLAEKLEQWKPASTGPFAGTWFRSRSYNIGAALTYLISQFSPSAHWRSRIEAGAKLDELVEAYLGGSSPEEIASLASAARARFGFETRRRDLEPVIRAAEKSEIKSVAEFLALAPYQLVLEPGAAGAGARPGFQAEAMTLLSPSTTALQGVGKFNLPADSFNLTASGHPVLLEGSPRRYSVLLPTAPLVDGSRPLAQGEHRLEKLRLVHEGYELTVNEPVTIKVEPQRMVIRLGEPPAARNPG